MKFLEHPNFSLFCFFLNFWFAITNLLIGSWFFFGLCTACAVLCARNYTAQRRRKK
jgi:hypothetical protein